MLLMTSTNHERCGVRAYLSCHALEYFRGQGCTKLMLRSIYPRFFSGLPDHNEKSRGFFERREWEFLSHKVWDLSSDLDQPLQASEISTDEQLFTEASGDMTCVGITSEERRRGIGLDISATANEILRQRRVKKAYVDWVVLLDFYRRTGYDQWRGYRCASF
ncbi:hypothetical protein BJV82DRAFT_678054 [Fennellomyces sp. T-0311]|nr:hypothetical protein BJV82DRAFT_678054 [Fennellomyces sp. T-0311]